MLWLLLGLTRWRSFRVLLSVLFYFDISAFSIDVGTRVMLCFILRGWQDRPSLACPSRGGDRRSPPRTWAR